MHESSAYIKAKIESLKEAQRRYQLETYLLGDDQPVSVLFYASRGDSSLSNNGGKIVADTVALWCRHLAVIFCEKHEDRTYTQGLASQAAWNCMAWNYLVVNLEGNLASVSETRYLFKLSATGLGDCLHHVNMDLGIGAERQFLLNSYNHSMGLVVKRVSEERYVIKYFDPNYTGQHMRLVCEGKDALKVVSIQQLVSLSDQSTYFPGTTSAVLTRYHRSPVASKQHIDVFNQEATVVDQLVFALLYGDFEGIDAHISLLVAHPLSQSEAHAIKYSFENYKTKDVARLFMGLLLKSDVIASDIKLEFVDYFEQQLAGMVTHWMSLLDAKLVVSLVELIMKGATLPAVKINLLRKINERPQLSLMLRLLIIECDTEAQALMDCILSGFDKTADKIAGLGLTVARKNQSFFFWVVKHLSRPRGQAILTQLMETPHLTASGKLSLLTGRMHDGASKLCSLLDTCKGDEAYLSKFIGQMSTIIAAQGLHVQVIESLLLMRDVNARPALDLAMSRNDMVMVEAITQLVSSLSITPSLRYKALSATYDGMSCVTRAIKEGRYEAALCVVRCVFNDLHLTSLRKGQLIDASQLTQKEFSGFVAAVEGDKAFIRLFNLVMKSMPSDYALKNTPV